MFFRFDIDDGLASGACPLCFAVALDEERWLESFWREGRTDATTRRRFYDAGGFCQDHAWRLHELVAQSGKTFAIADVYGSLAGRDLAETGKGVPLRTSTCPACTARTEALERKAYYLLELLATASGRERYERSHGLCLPHLAEMVATAGKDDELARFLIADWRRRLAEVRQRIDEPRAASDAISLYVGERRPVSRTDATRRTGAGP